MRLKSKSGGDTIIEVLLCLAILGFVMTIAYTISSRSLQNIRRAQERIEALKMAEGQIELLKNMQKSSNPTDVSLFQNLAGRQTDNPFCIDVSNSSGILFNTPITDQWEIELSEDKLNYPDQCEDQGPGNLYNIAITPPHDSNGGAFKIHVRWPRYGGGINDQVTMEYKLYANSY